MSAASEAAGLAARLDGIVAGSQVSDAYGCNGGRLGDLGVKGL